jgi:hypothetical protein
MLRERYSSSRNHFRSTKITSSQKCFFFHLDPSYFLTFSFLFHFKWFKVLYERHLQFYKSSLNSNSNKATYKFYLFRVICFVMLGGLFFWVFDSLYFEDLNFLSFSLLLMIFSVLIVSIRKVQILFGHQKQQNPLLGFSLPWPLKWLLMGCFTLQAYKLGVNTYIGNFLIHTFFG